MFKQYWPFAFKVISISTVIGAACGWLGSMHEAMKFFGMFIGAIGGMSVGYIYMVALLWRANRSIKNIARFGTVSGIIAGVACNVVLHLCLFIKAAALERSGDVIWGEGGYELQVAVRIGASIVGTAIVIFAGFLLGYLGSKKMELYIKSEKAGDSNE